jgi:hypothetical protein
MADNEKAAPAPAPKPSDELARLRAENERLRGQLAASGADNRLSQNRATRPFLSEGERQDLELNGVTNSPFTGERLTAQGEGVETVRDPQTAALPPVRTTGDRPGVEGFDFVYPSVAPGVLDPKLTGEDTRPHALRDDPSIGK